MINKEDAVWKIISRQIKKITKSQDISNLASIPWLMDGIEGKRISFTVTSDKQMKELQVLQDHDFNLAGYFVADIHIHETQSPNIFICEILLIEG